MWIVKQKKERQTDSLARNAVANEQPIHPVGLRSLPIVGESWALFTGGATTLGWIGTMGIMANIEEYPEEMMGWHRRYPPFDVFGATAVQERASEGEQMFQSLNPNRYLMVKLWHKTGNHHCRIAELNGDLKIIRRFLHSRLRTAEKQFCKFRLGSRQLPFVPSAFVWICTTKR